ncbi:MAG: hypothetical protein NTW14_14335 [bacterium]|nr:hypothetical protein [bacterium]
MWDWLKKLFSRQQQTSEPEEEPRYDERAHELLLLGDKMFAAMDFSGAKGAYESALRVDPHYADVWQRRGKIFLDQNELLFAAASFARALELNPQMGEAWCGLGQTIIAFFKADLDPLFVHENKVEIISEASECFRTALRIIPDHPAAVQGRQTCKEMLQGYNPQLAKPFIFTFHSGGILEKAKRDVVSPFLKPGDYRRRTPLPAPND